MKIMLKSKIAFALFLAILFLGACGPDIVKKDLNIVFVTDHAISDGNAPNPDLMALLSPLEPGTDHTYGFIPQVKLWRTDIGEGNTQDLDLSTFRSKIPLLPNRDFKYAAETRSHVISEINKPFELEAQATEGVYSNVDSLMISNYSDAITLYYGTSSENSANNYQNLDSLKSRLRTEAFAAGFDESKPIVIVYKTKGGRVSNNQMSDQEQFTADASFKGCYMLRWSNSNSNYKYSVSWDGYEAKIGSVSSYTVPSKYRYESFIIRLNVYKGGYDSLVTFQDVLKPSCSSKAAVENSQMPEPREIAPELGDMGLRITESGNITWEQKSGIVYVATLSKNLRGNAVPPLSIVFPDMTGRQTLTPNDPRIRNYFKKDFLYIFQLDAYDKNPSIEGSKRLACRQFNTLSIPSSGQGQGRGFYDAECKQESKVNKPCPY